MDVLNKWYIHLQNHVWKENVADFIKKRQDSKVSGQKCEKNSVKTLHMQNWSKNNSESCMATLMLTVTEQNAAL